MAIVSPSLQEPTAPSNDKLLLLSLTAEQASTSTKDYGGYTSPLTNMQAKEACHSPPPKMATDTQLNNRKRQRDFMSAGPLRISSSLNPQQAEALAMALNACRIKLKKPTRQTSNGKQPQPTTATTTKMVIPEAAKMQIRKHFPTTSQQPTQPVRPPVVDEIYKLRHQIGQLKAYKAKRIQQHQQIDPIEAIGDFYYALGIQVEHQQLPDATFYQRKYGCLPGLQLLLDLQREEFDSMASIKFHWLWYRQQFRVFEFAMKSYERMEAGGHSIINVSGDLRLEFVPKEGDSASSCSIVCPVLQQFEFEAASPSSIRITSEVDLVRGVASIEGQSSPESVLNTLQRLSETFCTVNRSQ